MYYQLFKHVLLGPGLKVDYRPLGQGAERTSPSAGPAILASNHLSFSDSIFLPLVMKRKLVFLGKAEYFTGKGIKGCGDAGVHGGRRHHPRSPRRRAGLARRRFGPAFRCSRNGDLLGIYPEGTRSPDGRLYRGKTGVARMAIESGVPVIPVAMIGTDIAQPIGAKVSQPPVRPA